MENDTMAVRNLQDHNALESPSADAPPSLAEPEPSALPNRPGHNALERAAAGAPPSPASLGSAATGSPICEGSESKAATKVQKVYRGYRTRRWLADAAVAESPWLDVIDSARLNHITITFFDDSKPETVTRRWNRVGLIAYRVGQGLSKDANALTLDFQHWIEAIDYRHRYGHNLQFYFEEWRTSQTSEPFFHWLDVGNGTKVNLEECPRSLLQKQCIKYLGFHERKQYEYEVIKGQIAHKQTGELLDTSKGPKEAKWIFVRSTSRRLFAGQKMKGMFHHSSFLAGGAALAAGGFTTENGVFKSISDDSGHYRPSDEKLNNFLTFLGENGVDLNEVEIRRHCYDDDKSAQKEKLEEFVAESEPPELEKVEELIKLIVPSPVDETSGGEASGSYKRTSSGGLKSPRADVPKEAIEERINSKRQKTSYQRQPSFKCAQELVAKSDALQIIPQS